LSSLGELYINREYQTEGNRGPEAKTIFLTRALTGKGKLGKGKARNWAVTEERRTPGKNSF